MFGGQTGTVLKVGRPDGTDRVRVTVVMDSGYRLLFWQSELEEV